MEDKVQTERPNFEVLKEAVFLAEHEWETEHAGVAVETLRTLKDLVNNQINLAEAYEEIVGKKLTKDN